MWNLARHFEKTKPILLPQRHRGNRGRYCMAIPEFEKTKPICERQNSGDRMD